MAKCNLLRPDLNQDGGTFYTFSQWADDMTLQNALGDAYRIVPSRFACFNISNTSNAGEKLQQYFEHPCAAMRHWMDVDTDLSQFSPKNASIIFWDALDKAFGIKNSGQGQRWPEMVFVGEMDLQGTNYIDGVSYSELYCIVPSNAKKMKEWEPAANPSSPDISFSDSSYGSPFGWSSTSLPSGASSAGGYPVTTKTYFDGPAMFNTEDSQTRYSSLNTLDSLHQVYMKDIFNDINYDFDLAAQDFEFNAVALFYDIVAKNEHNDYHYIYTAVPMGMYFTKPGTTVTKYVTNDDIYGQGTSYGLRVTTKFCAESLVTQSGQTMAGSTVTATIDDLYPEMSAVMDRFNAAAESLDEYTDNVQNSIEIMTNHISNFKDNKVNVPYIREIRGNGDTAPEKYWFVNGRSTGVKVSETYNIFYDAGTGSTSGPVSLENLIQNIITNDINNNNSDLQNYIDQSVANYITNNNPANVIALKPYIEYITPSEFHTRHDTSITEIPCTEDFQEIRGNDGGRLFENYSSLRTLPRLELHNADNLSSVCKNCSSLKTIYMDDTISCKDFDSAFFGCSSLENLTIDATNARSFNNAFTGCSSLKNLRIYNLDPTLVNTIDLSQTIIDFASLEIIVNSIKPQIYNESYDVNGPSQEITFVLPVNLSEDNRSVMDLIYNAQMNKNIRIIITH